MGTPTFDPTARVSGHAWLYGAPAGATRTVTVTRTALGRPGKARGLLHPAFFRCREAETKRNELLVEARRGARRQERTGVTFADVAED